MCGRPRKIPRLRGSVKLSCAVAAEPAIAPSSSSEQSSAQLYHALRDGLDNKQRYKSLLCKPCNRWIPAPPPGKDIKIKFQPDALDNLTEHLGGKVHRRVVSRLQERDAWQSFYSLCGTEVRYNHHSGELRGSSGSSE